jgi:hypothetical protein
MISFENSKSKAKQSKAKAKGKKKKGRINAKSAEKRKEIGHR